MPKIIKGRCNGPNKCINEVDLEVLIEEDEVTIYRIVTTPADHPVRDRYVLKCKHCSDGHVVITRQMIEENL